jgi:hypothetical protein
MSRGFNLSFGAAFGLRQARRGWTDEMPPRKNSQKPGRHISALKDTKVPEVCSISAWKPTIDYPHGKTVSVLPA